MRTSQISFWAPLCRRSIVKNHVIAPTREEDITLATGAIAHLIVGTRDVAAAPRGYMLAVVVSDRRIYTFEVWGPKDAFDHDSAALQAALKSLAVGKW